MMGALMSFPTPPVPVSPPDPGPGLSQDIVAIAQQGDREAFARLFRHFAPRVKAYMVRQGMAAARAEELAQETLLAVWNKAALFDPGRADAATWIFTIARNLRIDALRRERYPEVPDDGLDQRPDDRPLADMQAAANQESHRLRQALTELSADQAEVVRLSFFADLAHPAIAEKLNLPLGTVKSRLRLAMTKIRRALGEMDP